MAKLDTIDFTDDEIDLLVTVFDAAIGSPPEVEAFDAATPAVTQLTPAQTAALIKNMGGIQAVSTPSGTVLILGKNPW